MNEGRKSTTYTLFVREQ